jgi:ATP dependent DNA ligase domain
MITLGFGAWVLSAAAWPIGLDVDGCFPGPVTAPSRVGRGLPRNFRTDGFIDPCAPIRAAKPPAGPGWVHEVKHDDGYRLIVRRDGLAVRLFTRNGYDWTERYSAIAAAASKLLAKSFILDGEAVVCGADGSPYSMRSIDTGRCAKRSCRRSICLS